MSGQKLKILALCDSPTVTTGFARVARNILHRWSNFGIEIHCWAINFIGYRYDETPLLLFPGGQSDWNSPRKLNELLQLIHDSDYTHLWMLMDLDALGVHGFPQKLRQLCKKKNVRVMLHFPVDAPLEREWLHILDAVDAAVAITEYGRDEVRKALGKSLYPIAVIPHGVDGCFRPLPMEQRKAARSIELQIQKVAAGPVESIDFTDEDTFLMLNVNKNEWRKDPLRSLEILAGLRERGLNAKLVLRMENTSQMGGIYLDAAAKQLGLTYGKEWCHIGQVSDEGLVALYNAADLYLTTSLGEGWGLGVTEAMACHTPVAMPQHTSMAEIGRKALTFAVPLAERSPSDITSVGKVLVPAVWLDLEKSYVCGADTRLRRRVHLDGAVQAIENWERNHTGLRVGPAVGAFKTWDAVAQEMLTLLIGKEAAGDGGVAATLGDGGVTATGEVQS